MAYHEILKLRDIDNDIQRGYKFEQAMREIFPYDKKPPMSAIGDSEQFDGVFIWENRFFIVEAKAKEKRILTGSHDWEDFELKIRSRKQSIVNIFCSLYPVDEYIYTRASDLNKSGHIVIILDGLFWDDFVQSDLSIADVIEYMIYHVLLKYISVPPKSKIIEKWHFDTEDIKKKFSGLCLIHSKTMLRRYKSNHHEETYIVRDMEQQLVSYAENLKPSVLSKENENIKQICIIRESSGSGKTTSSIQIALTRDAYFGLGMTANELSIDNNCSLFFESLGSDYGLRELKKLNKPIVFVIDSLDEAIAIPDKKAEIRAILSFIDELKQKAFIHDLHAYPALFCFTVRDDYWRDWESIFEGIPRYNIHKKLSSFTDDEFFSALKKYSNYFGYTIINKLNRDTIDILSKPINLLIFSETNKDAGQIKVAEIWECSVIYNYFVRKLEDLRKRNILGYNPTVFMRILSEIAFNIIKTKSTIIYEDLIEEIFNHKYKGYTGLYMEILKAFVSEQILIRDVEFSGYRFRHSRFIEFLMAYYCVCTIIKYHNISLLDNLTRECFNSGVVSMFNVHENLLYICEKNYPEFKDKFSEYYAYNIDFMSRKISRIRGELAYGQKVATKNDIIEILKNTNKQDPQLLIEAYFVIVSKAYRQSNNDIINFFVAAFKTNYNIPEQYKMILKLVSNDLLINEKVLKCILNSNYPRNWETNLGGIIETMSNNFSEFICLWNQADGDKKFTELKQQSHCGEWLQVEKLIDIILNNKVFVNGSLNF